MLYIYFAMILSSLIFLTGLILSVIDLDRYNFGLYLALLAIVTFTIALAFFIVKPRACLGPRWFSKITGQSMIRNDRSRSQSGSMGDRQRRLVFFGLNTPGLFRSDLETTWRDSRTVHQSTRLLNVNGFHTTDYGDLKADDPPSTALIPPTPPSLDEEEEITVAADEDDTDESAIRMRAWTFTCANTKQASENGNSLDSVECWREWQRFLGETPNILLQSSFPLSERVPKMKCSSNNAKSWSTEEVVNLNDFLHAPKKSSSSKRIASKMASSPVDTCRIPNPSSRSDNHSRKTLSPSDDPQSWRRSRTITVKYVPVMREWISKPLSPAFGGLRKKSRSTNAMFTVIAGKGDGSPWWTSLTSLLQRAATNTSQHRVDMV